MDNNQFTKIQDVFSFFESFTNLEKKDHFSKKEYRLERIEFLLKLFNNPHFSIKTIHVAGSKGKGSTATFITSVLAEEGYKTGLYVSPHVSSYIERISVNLLPPDKRIIINLAKDIKDKIDKLINFSPTTFELLTILAFLYFREEKCDYAVVEVGIGGRLDATNVVLPISSVITPIELEHTEILGNTIEEIAYEKAGIIKRSVPVFSGIQELPVKCILNRQSNKLISSIKHLDEELEIFTASISVSGTDFVIKHKNGSKIFFHLSLIGEFQAQNASLAYLTLKNIMPKIRNESFLKGFSRAYLPGRMEIIQDNPPVIIDAAHTPLAARNALKTLNSLFPSCKILIFGSVIGKNHEKMSDILAAYFNNIIISTPGTFKQSDPEAIYIEFKKRNENTYLEKNPKKAFEKAQLLAEGRSPIFITGSFYMIAEIRNIIV